MRYKKRNFILSILVLSIFLLQSTALASGIYIPPPSPPPPEETTYRVYGYVKESGTNNPIYGATVKIYKGTSTYIGKTTTSSTGYYNFYYKTTSTITTVKSVASKSGYYTSSKTGTMVEDRVRIDHYLDEKPPPPSQPVISNVKVAVGSLKVVTVSWDTSWGSTATSYSSKCWWSLDSSIDSSDLIYSSSSSKTHHSITVPQDRLLMFPSAYWFKIEAINSNDGGSSSPAVYGPQSTTISSWRITPTDDAYTYEYYENNNYNTDKLYVRDYQEYYQKTWMGFNIPSPSEVVSATLFVFVYSIRSDGYGTVDAWSTDTDWSEEDITESNEPENFYLLLDSSSEVTVGEWVEWDITEVVYSSETIAIALLGSGGPDTGAAFYSKEYSDASLRPYLEVEYISSVTHVLNEDCSSLAYWTPYTSISFGTTQVDFQYSPFSYYGLSDDYYLDPSSGAYRLATNGGGTGGTVYTRSLTEAIPLHDLSSFEFTVDYIQSDYSGSIVVALYDNDYVSNYNGDMTKPMIMADVFVDYPYGLSINAYYVDESLGKQSGTLVGPISEDWSGTVKFWYDTNGLWVQASSGNPVLIASWGIASMRREAAHVVIQGTGTDYSVPNLSIDNIKVMRRSASRQFLDLRTANQMRSGPKDIELKRPGPTNELQFLPLDGEGLEFRTQFHASFDYSILLDVRAIPIGSPQGNPIINISVAGQLVDSYYVTVDPAQNLPTANYLHESHWTCSTTGYATIELIVSGWSPADGVVALRGIWILETDQQRWLMDLEQVFPSSGELRYYVPMGPDTYLDLEWTGLGGIQVLVDDHLIDSINLHTVRVVLGDYSRGTMYELTIRHTGTNHEDASISVMHTSHFWLTVEIDYISFPSNYWSNSSQAWLDFPGSGQTEGYTNFEDYLAYVWDYTKDYYESTTHGRLDYIIDEAIDYDSYVESVEQGSGWNPTEIALFGETHFSHKGDRNYAWAFYGDNLAGSGGYYIKSTDGVPTNDLRDVWVLIAVQWHHWPSATAHELGHLAHVHEGYDPPTDQAEPCDFKYCPMGPLGGCHEWTYCQFHWFQTWLNTRNQSSGDMSHPPEWWYDWWLL